MERAKIRQVSLHGIFIIFVLSFFFISSIMSKQTESILLDARQLEEEAKTTWNHYRKTSCVYSEYFEAMQEENKRTCMRTYNEVMQGNQRKQKESWGIAKRAEKLKRLSENINWTGSLLSVIYCFCLTIWKVVWINKGRINELGLKTKLLLTIFIVLLIYYTTDGRLITRSSRPEPNFWWVTAKQCKSSCNFTWLDKILFRRCISNDSGFCHQFNPEEFKKLMKNPNIK